MDAAQPIETYADLIAALRARLDEAGNTMANVDAIAGLPDRLCAALLAPDARKVMSGYHLIWIAASLGLRLMLVPDDEALAKLRQRDDWCPMTRTGPRYRSRGRRVGWRKHAPVNGAPAAEIV